jgi:hypothetical protein
LNFTSNSPIYLGEVFDWVRTASSEVVLCCKAKDSWSGHVKSQHLEDEMFHSQHLLLGVSVVGDVDKLTHIRRVNLLEFSAKINKLITLNETQFL